MRREELSPTIENRSELTDHGNKRARDALLTIAEEAIASVHPAKTVASALSHEGHLLIVDGEEYDLRDFDNIFVIGAGKGSVAVVEEIQSVLDREITGGIVAEKAGQERSLSGVEVIGAGHPIPDDTSIEAGTLANDIAARAGDSDLVIACITGGTSAQLVAPPDGISLEDLSELTTALLRAGLSIDEINTVRKHVSTIKGGSLAAAIAPATTVGFILVDEVAGEPWGPTVGDRTTPADAVDVLERSNLIDAVPESIVTFLREETAAETPSPADVAALPTQTVVLADATDVCEAAARTAADLGYDQLILSTRVEGESKDVGTAFASIAQEAAEYSRPAEPPCALVSGGETTVTVTGNAGRGGPNQEFALSAALSIENQDSITALAIGTDGTDGPTDVAGGLVDESTVSRLRARSVDPVDHLRSHNASYPLERARDAVYTGSTETNVMDLRVFLVGEADMERRE